MNPKEKNIKIPMELIYVLGGEHYKKKLDSQGTADMVRACANPAPDRAKTINFYAKNNNYENDVTINDFGLQVSNKMVELDGRILPNRRMITKSRDAKQDVRTEPRRGVWQTDKSSYFDAQPLKRWTLYCAENERFLDQSMIKGFVKKLQIGGRNVGMNISEPISPKYLHSTDEVERAMREARDNDLQQVVFILGMMNGNPFYAKIKQVGDVKFGVRTQCITARNVKRANNQLIGNVLLKMNAKLNGVNNICKNPDGTSLLAKPTMIMGADVTHPAPGDNSRPSIAAVVASMNATATVYHSEIRVQAHRQETIGSIDDNRSAHLEDMVVENLKQFYRSTKGAKPVHLIYFRDGVSEGQYQDILKHELNQIRNACKKLNANFKPTITFVVCTKRHHARMFCQNEGEADGKSRNIPAGTIVDTVITHPTQFDFYLCSHAGIQGTSRPTHYHVLFNNDKHIAESPDILQSLTYSLCHVYQRCQRSVSIPAPVYYAHLGAYRATVHLQNEDDGASSTYSGDDNISLNSEGAQQLQDRVRLHDKLKPTRNAQTNALLGCQHFM
jgi:eukaryotic translation initiation factor 2C